MPLDLPQTTARLLRQLLPDQDAVTALQALVAELATARERIANLEEEVAILTGPMLCDECDALISVGEE